MTDPIEDCLGGLVGLLSQVGETVWASELALVKDGQNCKSGYPVRPDSIAHGVLEIKDKINISSTAQLRGVFDVAVNVLKQPFNLVVSMSNQSISASVQDMIYRSGGSIVRFDGATGTFLPWP